MKPERPFLIFNPHTGKKIFKVLRKILPSLEKIFGSVTVFESVSIDAMQKKLEDVHTKNEYDLIVSLGGDGTISSIANCLMKIEPGHRLPLLPLPSGTGDSLVRDFGVKNIRDALSCYKKTSAPVMFDILKVEQLESGKICYCINVLGMGFVSDLAAYAVKHGKSFGSLSYFLGAYYGLKEFRPYKTVLTCNGGKEKYSFDKAYFLTVSNTKYTGGAVKIAPDAEYDDGLLDIIVLHDISRVKFFRGYIGAFSGAHVKDRGCTYIKTPDVVIESDPVYSLMPDGDPGGSSPVKVTVCPGQIPIFLS